MGLASVVVMACLSFSPNAKASDQKIYHGLHCQPLSPQTSYADLLYRPAGVKNITNGTQYVVCSVLVDLDSTANWTATDSQTASIAVTFHSETASNILCEVSVGSNLDGTKATFSNSGAWTAGQVKNVTLSNVHADDVVAGFLFNQPVSLYCRIPPQATLLRLRVIENNVDTDDGAL
jgi:hypothetical protein